MKDKVLFYAVVILMVVIVAQSIHTYLLIKKIDAAQEKQYDELERLKINNLSKSDSIEVLKVKKETLIAQKQKLLYDDINRATQNNIRYEQIKKYIGNTNDADSLARQLTERYYKR